MVNAILFCNLFRFLLRFLMLNDKMKVASAKWHRKRNHEEKYDATAQHHIHSVFSDALLCLHHTWRKKG